MYYLASSVETVVNITNYGTLPSNLPSYLNIKELVCAKTPSGSIPQETKKFDQIFILALKLNEEKEESLKVQKIDPKKITHFIAYSERGINLLTNLFKKKCPHPIILEPSVFPSLTSTSEKRSREEDEKKSSTNKAPAINSSSPSTPILDKYRSTSFKNEVERISTTIEHINKIKHVFHEAKSSILITSYSINEATFQLAGLDTLLPAAVNRGVRIYIYFNDKKDISKKIETFLTANRVKFDCAFTHSKILACDRSFVAAGSCNWLSVVDTKYPESDEGTFVFKGPICEELIDEFWEYLKHYRNIQFRNYSAVEDFDDDSENEATGIFKLDNQSEVGYLPTLEQHLGFLEECLTKAKQRIILCSPFISSVGQYKQNINVSLLKKIADKGIKVYFVCLASSPMLKDFEHFLAELNSPNVYLITVNFMHLKTFIIDDQIIGEGSFNWLSASRDIESEFHNHEQTLFVEGAKASGLIENFFTSRVGKIISTEILNPENSSSQIAIRIKNEPSSSSSGNFSNSITNSCIIS